MKTLILLATLIAASCCSTMHAQTIDDFLAETEPSGQATPAQSQATPQLTVPPSRRPGLSPPGVRIQRASSLMNRVYRPTISTPRGDRFDFGITCRSHAKGGAVVDSVARDTLAEQLGFRKGDIVHRVNQQNVASGYQLTQLLSKSTGILEMTIIESRSGRSTVRMCVLD